MGKDSGREVPPRIPVYRGCEEITISRILRKHTADLIDEFLRYPIVPLRNIENEDKDLVCAVIEEHETDLRKIQNKLRNGDVKMRDLDLEKYFDEIEKKFKDHRFGMENLKRFYEQQKNYIKLKAFTLKAIMKGYKNVVSNPENKKLVEEFKAVKADTERILAQIPTASSNSDFDLNIKRELPDTNGKNITVEAIKELTSAVNRLTDAVLTGKIQIPAQAVAQQTSTAQIIKESDKEIAETEQKSDIQIQKEMQEWVIRRTREGGTKEILNYMILHPLGTKFRTEQISKGIGNKIKREDVSTYLNIIIKNHKGKFIVKKDEENRENKDYWIEKNPEYKEGKKAEAETIPPVKTEAEGKEPGTETIAPAEVEIEEKQPKKTRKIRQRDEGGDDAEIFEGINSEYTDWILSMGRAEGKRKLLCFMIRNNDKGFTMKELGEKTGLTNSQLNNYLHGLKKQTKDSASPIIIKSKEVKPIKGKYGGGIRGEYCYWAEIKQLGGAGVKIQEQPIETETAQGVDIQTAEEIPKAMEASEAQEMQEWIMEVTKYKTGNTRKILNYMIRYPFGTEFSVKQIAENVKEVKLKHVSTYLNLVIKNPKGKFIIARSKNRNNVRYWIERNPEYEKSLRENDIEGGEEPKDKKLLVAIENESGNDIESVEESKGKETPTKPPKDEQPADTQTEQEALKKDGVELGIVKAVEEDETEEGAEQDIELQEKLASLPADLRKYINDQNADQDVKIILCCLAEKGVGASLSDKSINDLTGINSADKEIRRQLIKIAKSSSEKYCLDCKHNKEKDMYFWWIDEVSAS